MPKPASAENSQGEHLIDYVLMKSPAGEVRRVPAKPEAIKPLMIAGWNQVTVEMAPPDEVKE
jgi:hypothetical protein